MSLGSPGNIRGGIPKHSSSSHSPTGVAAGSYDAPTSFDLNEAGHVTGADRAWSSTRTYAANAITIGSDSNLYISLVASNLNNDPVADDGSNWKRIEPYILDNISAGSGITVTPSSTGVTIAANSGTGVSVWKEAVRVATAAALPAYSRVGNVITASANGALAAVDGVSLSVNDRLLLKDGAAGEDNGLYTVTSLGDGSNPFVLTRSTDADVDAEVLTGLAVYVQEGTVNAGRAYVLATTGTITLNTTSLSFVHFGSDADVPVGTTANSTLRWDGSSWVENTILTSDGAGSTDLSGTSYPLKVQSTNPAVLRLISTASLGGGTGSGIYSATYDTPTADGQRLAFKNFGSFRGGTGGVVGASIDAYSDGAGWTSDTSYPSRLVFSTVPSGSTALVSRVRIGNAGDVYLRASHSDIATGDTAGFTHLPTVNGTPTGTPANTINGCSPFVFDRANAKLYAYNSGWKQINAYGYNAQPLMVLDLMSGFTPNTVGADSYEFTVPYDADGQSITWTFTRVTFRHCTTSSSGNPTINIQKSTGTGQFSSAGSLLGTDLTITAGSYQNHSTSFTTATVSSGEKLRVNVLATGTGTAAWSVIVEAKRTS